MDTSLQPIDIGQEILDQNFQDILCLAPAEGNNPVTSLINEGNEARSFPVLYPTGHNTYSENRSERITLSPYFQSRLMNADSRFAQNSDYIFYAQYAYEVSQVMSNVSIAMRKGTVNSHKKTITKEMLTSSESLRDILRYDEGYKSSICIR